MTDTNEEVKDETKNDAPPTAQGDGAGDAAPAEPTPETPKDE